MGIEMIEKIVFVIGVVCGIGLVIMKFLIDCGWKVVMVDWDGLELKLVLVGVNVGFVFVFDVLEFGEVD